ncbi:MAG: hypothetical protein Q9214_006375, partial [Letrouitia sp. 1 TL-2023]
MVSISNVKLERHPHASIRVFHDLPNKFATNRKLKYISFYFWEDDEPADVAWTFTVPDENEFIDVLRSYAYDMRGGESDEYVRVFQSFITTLVVKALYFRPAGTFIKGTRKESDDDLPKNGGMRKSKTPIPAILLPGKARDEEMRQRLQKGQSFLDLASFFDRTPGFIIREAKRLFGEY